MTRREIALKNLAKAGHPGRPKGVPNQPCMTIHDLWQSIHQLEATIKEKTGKDFDYIGNILKDSLSSERLKIAILDRICPVPREIKHTGEIAHSHQLLMDDLIKYGISRDDIIKQADSILARRQGAGSPAIN